MIDPLIRLGKLCRNWAVQSKPWTNTYGLARTLLATGTAATLALSHSTTLFRPAWGVPEVPVCHGISRIGLFCVASNHHLELARWTAVVILLVVASGWYPRFTGPWHWWVSFSLASSAVLIDGGDQVSEVLTLLLLPVTMTDPRKWHWQISNQPQPHWKSLLALSSLIAVRVQVAGIYLHAAVGKLGVQEWRDGTALYYWFIHPDFGAPRPVWYVLEPLLRHGTTLALMTWSAIVVEICLFMALVMPKRAWGYFLLVGLVFHTSIAVIHGLVSFGFAMAGALVLYLRPTEKLFVVPAFFQSFFQSRKRSTSHQVAKAEPCHGA